MTIDTGEFPTELRGYKRSDVDAALRDLRNELVQAAKDRQQAQEDLRVVREELEILRQAEPMAPAPAIRSWVDD
jgi:DivIVA domain